MRVRVRVRVRVMVREPPSKLELPRSKTLIKAVSIIDYSLSPFRLYSALKALTAASTGRGKGDSQGSSSSESETLSSS